MIELNAALDRVEPSRSVTLMAKIKKMQADDPAVLNLTGGEPDFDTPKAICDEVYRQMLAGNTHYGDSKGDPELRQAIADKLNTENQADYTADQILVTPGGKYAIYAAVQALVNPGDEVMWLTPGWVSYPAIVTLCGGTPVAVHLDYEQDYAITEAMLEAHTSDKTKAICINFPNNPTGKILSESDEKELKSWLRKHPDVFVISDEIYEKIIFDGRKVVSLAADPEFRDRVIIINGFSKCSAMTGWRLGYLACAPEIYKAALKIFQHSMSCTNSFIQKGAVVALNLPEETEKMRAAYEHRRNIVFDGLKEIPNVEFRLPEGAFYAWVKFDTEKSSEEVCDLLLEKAKIGGIPGVAYGEEGGCLVRFCYAKNDETLKDFTSRMQEFCATVL